MRILYYTKLFIHIVFIILILMTINDLIQIKTHILDTINQFVSDKKSGIKYILLWTQQNTIPFEHMGNGQEGFINRKCNNTNCVVTSDVNLLGNYSNFDVIAFAAPQLLNIKDPENLPDPKKRSPTQKYVFSSIESARNYPLCTNYYDGYFNWTWTYKLDSDVRWGYIVIRDLENNIIGPNKIMHWLHWDEMGPVSNELKMEIKSKTKAAAWFVSNCQSASRRESFAHNLQRELRKYNLSIDIFGACGTHSCPRDDEAKCNQMISREYYFYLSFENAFSEDYVTEKMLIPLQNNVVPIVYGGANYSRFLPHGSYLNARELGIHKLAKTMSDLINNPEEYANYFKWKNHYKYQKTTDNVDSNEYCRMCALLNDEHLMKKKTVYQNLREWWDPPDESC